MAIHIVPAYGRAYLNAQDAVADWEDGKDFRIGLDGPYCSIRDLDSMVDEFEEVWLHWDWPDGIDWIVVSRK